MGNSFSASDIKLTIMNKVEHGVEEIALEKTNVSFVPTDGSPELNVAC